MHAHNDPSPPAFPIRHGGKIAGLGRAITRCLPSGAATSRRRDGAENGISSRKQTNFRYTTHQSLTLV